MRRVRVAEGWAAAIATSFGVIATFSDASPTGGRATDAIVVFAAVSVVAWLAASAPWWALAAAGGAAALTGFAPVPIALGAAGAVAAFAIGTTRDDISLARTTSAGCTALALCHLQLGGFFGATALIGLACAALLIGTGLARRKRATRRWVQRGSIGLAIFAVLASVGAGVSLASARGDLVAGREYFETGIDGLRGGDTTNSAADFARADKAFGAADRAISRPWAQPARLVPVFGNHRAAAAVAARSGRAASADIETLVSVLDIDALRPQAGRFDLDTIGLLRDPFTEAYGTLLDIGDDINAAQSPWLIGSVQDELRATAAEFQENIDTFGTLTSAVQRASTLLGADGPRTYFIAFTTPAEARGAGGFMGNFAVLTADRGLVTLSNFGRTLDLNRGSEDRGSEDRGSEDRGSEDRGSEDRGFDDRTVDAPAEWLRQWGRYGFDTGPDGTTSGSPWSNITISPHFPSTATAIASLFPQSGGSEIDGVIAIDPYVLQAFVGFTGPITVESSDTRLTSNNTARFLLFDQYAIDSEERVDALEQVATETMTELLNGALPDPAVLADQLGPLVEQERLVAWMSDAADQALIESIGMSGSLPPLDGDDDGFSVVVNNAGANKLDAFLTRSFTYDATYDPVPRAGNETDGIVDVAVDGELSITLTSSAPTFGLDDGVIGNYVGDPLGTNRSLVTLYTAASVESVTVDGDEVPTEGGTEAGWTLTTFVVTTPAGSATDIVVQIAGSLLDNDGKPRTGPLDFTGEASSNDTPSRSLVVRTQPLVDTPTYEISTRDADGRQLVAYDGDVPGSRRWNTD